MARDVHPRQKRAREVHPHRDGLCRWCSGPVTPPRRSWCSDACVQEYLAGDPKALRGEVEKRDRGVCAECGRDTATLATKLRAILDPFYAFRATWTQKKRALRWDHLLLRLRLTKRTCILRHLWEADHIVPVCEGGANELANLRTLCLPCHKAETRALAARRAQRRAAERAAAAEAVQPSLALTTGEGT